MAFAHCWAWFCELNQTRSIIAGPAGAIPAPIRYAEMAAWSALTGHRPTPLEAEMLRLIDRLWLTPPEGVRNERDPQRPA